MTAIARNPDVKVVVLVIAIITALWLTKTRHAVEQPGSPAVEFRPCCDPLGCHRSPVCPCQRDVDDREGK